MNAWRVSFAMGLLFFVGVPLALPFGELLAPAAWEWTADDASRLAHVGRNTLVLTVGTATISLPLGVCLAVLLFRTSFPGRRILLILMAVALFVPTPVLIASWRGMLGFDQPLATGMAPAIWIHTLAAIPWVAFIVGIGLTWVEPELEDEAAQIVGPWRVLGLVTMPRARASILAAALVVALQTSTEAGVAEMMLVPTLAEEARRQFALSDEAGLARTLLLSLPGLIAVWAGVLVVLAYLETNLPPLTPPTRTLRPLDVGWPSLRAIVGASLVMVIAMPCVSLIWRLGLSGYPSQWSVETAYHSLAVETGLLGKSLVRTLTVSIGTGFLTSCAALAGCWLAREARWFRWLLFSVATWAWVTPGPVVGIGLRGLITALPAGPWMAPLYYAPSPAPLIWVQGLRALPIAVVFLWPVVRMIPREWFEEARLGGAGVVSEFAHVVAPLTWRAALIAGLAASALCLGEVAASGRVETPGWESFTTMLLNRIHYGVDNSLAALAVLMLASIGGAALTIAGLTRIARF